MGKPETGGPLSLEGKKLRGLGVGEPHEHTSATEWEGSQLRREMQGRGATGERGRAGQWGACRALSDREAWEGLPQGVPSAAVCGCAQQRCQDLPKEPRLAPGPLTQAVLWALTDGVTIPGWKKA